MVLCWLELVAVGLSRVDVVLVVTVVLGRVKGLPAEVLRGV